MMWIIHSERERSAHHETSDTQAGELKQGAACVGEALLVL